MFGKDYRWTVGALSAIHTGLEAFLITLLEYGNLLAIHAGRITIMVKDIQLVMRITEIKAWFHTEDEVTGEKARERQRLLNQSSADRQQQILGLQWQR